MSSNQHYLPRAELVRLIGMHRVTGFVCDELGKALQKIAEGVWAKYYRHLDQDEFSQSCCLAMLLKLPRIDLNSNPFSYLSQCCRNTGHTLNRQRTRRTKQHADYMADAVELERYRHRRRADCLCSEGESCDC